MKNTNNKLEVNNLYYFVTSSGGRARKGRLLGFVNHFNTVWVNFQCLEKKAMVPIEDIELYDVGIGLNPKEARELHGKIAINQIDLIYESSEDFYKDLISKREYHKGKNEYLNKKTWKRIL